MKNLEKIQMVTGGLTTILFFVHVILMTLLLTGTVGYSASYKYMGIALIVMMVVHIIVSCISILTRKERNKKFYRLK